MYKVTKINKYIRTYLMRTPMERRNACVRASALLISCENSSLPASIVNGMSLDMALAIPKDCYHLLFSNYSGELSRTKRETEDILDE